jgi:hypothetical protein
MRLVLSWLREFVDVKASAEDVAGTLALRGFEVASIEPLDGGDAVIDFEVTANRPDALSVIGLAREVATAYDLPLTPPGTDADATVRLAELPLGLSDRVTIAIDDTSCVLVRGSGRGRSSRSVARLAGRSPHGRWHPSHQLDRRHHELCEPRARPADARLRSRADGGRSDPGAPRKAG